MTKVFIDGGAGTTGLRIKDRLSVREDIELITVPSELRKDLAARKEAINNSDITFLCLPDDAAREAVSLLENKTTRIIDTSTAHRTESGWAYGFPELGESFLEKIKASQFICVPGCHASGFISLVAPIVYSGIIDSDTYLTCHSITGYSGGGKKMIAQYELSDDILLKAPRQYALSQNHKHLKEMKAICSLTHEPVFCPIVADYYCGMSVTVPLFIKDLCKGKTVDDIKNSYRGLYNNTIVSYSDSIDEDGFLSANTMSDKDSMQISVLGNDERILLISRFNNLGKGASGAAIECMNIVLGKDPTTGLDL